jgi:hypothetical protein
MTLQHHFIVVVEEGKIFIDHDHTEDRFYDGAVWNNAANDWESSFDHATQYEAASELLQDLLMKGTN